MQLVKSVGHCPGGGLDRPSGVFCPTVAELSRRRRSLLGFMHRHALLTQLLRHLRRLPRVISSAHQ